MTAGEKRKKFWDDVNREMRRHKGTFIVFLILRILVVISMIRQFMLGNYESVMLCVLTLLLFVVPMVVQVRLNVDFPQVLEVIILLFIYAAEILGEVNSYYTAIPYWDIMLHTLNGFLCGAIGFSLAICLDKDEKVFFRMSPLLIVIVSFSFSMTIGVLWEFFEYAADHILLLDMQKDTVVHTVSSVLMNPMKVQRPWIIRNITEMSINGTEMGVGGYVDLGLIDTMEDLFVNFIGALTFSVIGWLALHGKRRERMIAMGLAVVPKMPEQELAAYRKRLEDDELRRLLEFEEEPGTKEAKGAQENDLKAETEKRSVKEH
ncbi:MAG: hypothetical protein ABS879_02310 [Eubacteriales bacterium]